MAIFIRNSKTLVQRFSNYVQKEWAKAERADYAIQAEKLKHIEKFGPFNHFR